MYADSATILASWVARSEVPTAWSNTGPRRSARAQRVSRFSQRHGEVLRLESRARRGPYRADGGGMIEVRFNRCRDDPGFHGDQVDANE